jgi:hypothetical protein
LVEESMRFLGCKLLVVVMLAFGPVAAAPALTLGQLVGGATFSTGPLTFTDFQATAAGSADPTFDDYAVQVLADGFRISGPVSATLGQTGTLLLSYEVTTAAPGIAGASLFSSGTAVGAGSVALVAEGLFGPGNAPLGTLLAYDVVGVGSVPLSSMSFGPVSELSVGDTLQVQGGAFAAIPFVDQRFVVIPEPMPFFLLAIGLIGLLVGGRRRQELRDPGA